MASKDWDWKYRDIQPERPVSMTPKQKWRNWWDYHKWHIVIAAILLAAVADLGCHLLGIGKIEPDYQFAYVGSIALPEDTAAALQTQLAALGEDCNGDGQVVVQLNQYIAAGTMELDAEYAYASGMKLMADLEACDSYFFILEDAETFQMNYQVLAAEDGTLPKENSDELCTFFWEECPILNGLELGDYAQDVLGQKTIGRSQEWLQGMQFARRGFADGRSCLYQEQCDALWEILTEGAIP